MNEQLPVTIGYAVFGAAFTLLSYATLYVNLNKRHEDTCNGQ